MKLFIALLTLLTHGQWAFAVKEKAIQIKTPRGEVIDAVVHSPGEKGKSYPALIIASGQGYHMDLPLIKGLAEKVSKMGYVALRFNWHYQSSGGRPSKGLLEESEDFESALNYLKAQTFVDPNKILIAGKSMGTGVAYKAFQKDTSIQGLLLMTPICTTHWDEKGNDLPGPIPVGSENYPGLLEETRPVVMMLGNKDPLCQIPMLYDFLKDSSGNISSLIFEGDHSLNIGPWDDPKFEGRNAQNNSAATEATAHWVKLIIDSL